MFSKVSIPWESLKHECSRMQPLWSRRTDFGEEGGAQIAGEYDVPLLGQVPFIERFVNRRMAGFRVSRPSRTAKPVVALGIWRGIWGTSVTAEGRSGATFTDLIGKG